MSFFVDDYSFDDNKNYLIYLRGGISPPTRGHFSLIEKFSHLYNVKYFIHQIGERHNISYDVNRKILKIYINELLDKKKITLWKMGSCLEVLEHVEDIDIVIYLKGDEGNGYSIEQFTDIKNRYKPLLKQLKKRNIPMHFLVISRPLINKLSATKFVEAVRENPNDKKNLRYFVPKGLSDKSFNYIIKQIKNYV